MKPTKLTYEAENINGNLWLPIKLIEADVKEYYPNSNLIIEIKEDRPKRSNDQNRYYRGVVLKYYLRGFKEAGNTWLNENIKDHLDHVHEIIKARFFSDTAPIITLPDGSKAKGKPTTTKESTVQWEERMKLLRQTAFEWFGYTIPLPNEVL